MKTSDFIALLEKSKLRFHAMEENGFGAIIALDIEGRIFTSIGGEIVSRVNADAIGKISTRNGYCNPGGDTLWPAPEGTSMGYSYATGKWRVPPGVTSARYSVASSSKTTVSIEAEVDLINSTGHGIPCVFRRNICLAPKARRMTTGESIEYVGSRSLTRTEFLLAPWLLSQFDGATGSVAVFPYIPGSMRDLYDPSDAFRIEKDGLSFARLDASARFQLALGKDVEWIEFRNPAKGLTVRRTAKPACNSLDYIDIIDAPPSCAPSAEGARFSIYCDKSGFMEIEAVGGCPSVLEPNAKLEFEIDTKFSTL